MQLCLIDRKKFNRSGSKKTLVDELESTTIRQFLLAAGINGNGWREKCPCTRCTGTLRVALVDAELHEFAAWCPECGWTPAEGFDIEPHYYTLSEASDLLGITYDTIHGMVKNGKIGAVDFGRSQHGSWRIPKNLIDTVVRLNGDWTVFWEVL